MSKFVFLFNVALSSVSCMAGDGSVNGNPDGSSQQMHLTL